MGIPSLIRFLKQIQESPVMAGSTTPGGQVVAPPPPPAPPSQLSHRVITAPTVPNNGIVGLPYGTAPQTFTMENSSAALAQDPQSQITAGPSHMLRQNLLQQRPSYVQNSVKSDPSRASFVYLLPTADTSNPTFGSAAAPTGASAITVSNLNEPQPNISMTQDTTSNDNQQVSRQNEPISDPHSSSLRLPTQLKMTASCMNTPAPQINIQPDTSNNTFERSNNGSNPKQFTNINQNSNNGERLVPNKQERVESCFGILGLRGDDQSRSGSRATLASLGSFTLQPPGNSSGVSPGSTMRMESGVSSIAAQFSFVQSSTTTAGITAISDISSSSNGPQIGGTGSNVLESKA